MRIYPKDKKDESFPTLVADLVTKSGWKFDELSMDKGRLDEVFRGITLPDTVKKSSKEGPVVTVNV